MIYTVTFNPSLDYIVSVKDFQLGLTNRASEELLFPGGKGINVSMVLRSLGICSVALGFAAGFTGEELVRRLGETGVQNDFIRLESGLTRINVKLRSVEGTEINGRGPEISGEKLALLMGRLDSLGAGDVLFLSGSIPASVPDDIYQRIMERLDGKGVITAVDATGQLLLNVLSYRPFLIKPNNHEIEDIFGVELKSREQALPYAKRLQEQGAQNVLVSMGGEGAVLVAADGQVFSAPAPKGILVNGVGAGDSMAAGFMAGWMEKGDYEHAFRMGIAAGSASAFSEHFASKEDILKIYRKISV